MPDPQAIARPAVAIALTAMFAESPVSREAHVKNERSIL
jgi:hypothetical protein